MRYYFKKLVGAVLAATLIFTPLVVHASQAEVDRLKEESNKASQAVDEINKTKDAVEDAKDTLENQANTLTGTIGSLNSQITSVSGQISDTEENIAAIQNDLDVLNEQLETTQKSLDDQKSYMKKRIQYMYENKSTNQLVALLESGSIAELLKRIEYMSAITAYDNAAVEQFEATSRELQSTKEAIETKSADLSAYQDTLESKKNELHGLVSSTTTALNTTNEQIADTQEAIEALEDQLAEAKAYETKIRNQYQAAQVALAESLAGQYGGYSGGYSSTDDDVLLLAALIQAEADNQGYEGRLAVGSVVMNRVASGSFPNSIAGVIYATNQFAPVASGRVALILAQGPNSGCQQAAADAIAGSTNVDSLFFCTYSYAQSLHEQQVAEGKEGFLDRTEGRVINAHYFYNYK